MKQDDQFKDKKQLAISQEKPSEIITNTISWQRECDLKGQGWTTEMIKKYLGEPARITITKKGIPNPLYPRSLVKKALTDPQVQELRKANIKNRQIARMNRLRPIYDEMENMTSNLNWLKEYIFQKVKEGTSAQKHIDLFNELEYLTSKIDVMVPKRFSSLGEDLKKNWLKKESILVKKALAVLDISEERFIEFIANKKNGVYAQEILRLGLNHHQENQ
ncbi:MAG TPA: hypothetical protein VNV85_04175 [Puia sp.]|jgi:hypothetical protein|nr:hypothetical protein [Puia sp.]